MTRKEAAQLHEILYSKDPWINVRPELKAFLSKATISEEPKGTRTNQQNRAIHLDCKLIAEKLEAAGIDWKQVIREGGVDVPVTATAVKELMWRPVMKLMYGIESTRDLKKTEGQIEKIHETIMRALGEKHGIEWHDFPTNENLRAVQFEQMDNLKKDDYPDDYEEPLL